MTHLGRVKTKNFNGKDKTAPSLFKHLLLHVEFRSDKDSPSGPPNLELTVHTILLAKTFPVMSSLCRVFFTNGGGLRPPVSSSFKMKEWEIRGN